MHQFPKSGCKSFRGDKIASRQNKWTHEHTYKVITVYPSPLKTEQMDTSTHNQTDYNTPLPSNCITGREVSPSPASSTTTTMILHSLSVSSLRPFPQAYSSGTAFCTWASLLQRRRCPPSWSHLGRSSSAPVESQLHRPPAVPWPPASGSCLASCRLSWSVHDAASEADRVEGEGGAWCPKH